MFAVLWTCHRLTLALRPRTLESPSLGPPRCHLEAFGPSLAWGAEGQASCLSFLWSLVSLEPEPAGRPCLSPTGGVSSRDDYNMSQDDSPVKSRTSSSNRGQQAGKEK